MPELNHQLAIDALRKLCLRWRKDADQYMKQVEEARRAATPHDQMMAMATALRGCAKDLEQEIGKEASGSSC